MARVYMWSPTEMREREEAFAALVDSTVLAVSRKASRALAADNVVVAAGAPTVATVPPPPVSLGSVAAVTGMWNGAVTAELMPALTDAYLEAAGVVWTGASDAFPDVALPMISDSFAENYLARAKNRLVNIGETVWQNIREQLLVGFSLGESTTKLAQRVVDAGHVSLARANVIARTEVNAAASMGGFQQVMLMGMTGTKEWLDTSDERTRCTHRAAGGQTVPLDGRFRLGGELECGKFGISFLLVPGDPTAPIGETIQCRCSVAYDLELAEESVITAAAEVHTGAMIALIPSEADAQRMVLTDAYAEPADQLHVTLLYLGEAVEWGDENRRLLTDVVAEIASRYVAVQTETFSVNVFNPNDDEFDTAIVLGVRGSDLLIALHKVITTNVADIFDDEVPEQHNPWVPHITLAYTDEVAEVLPEALEKLGPVTFDRIRVVFAGEATDYPLPIASSGDAALVASQLGDPDWDESKVKRDQKGQFAKKIGFGDVADFLKLIESKFKSGDLKEGAILGTWVTKDTKKKHRLIVSIDSEGTPSITQQEIMGGKWENYNSTYLYDKTNVKMWLDEALEGTDLTISPNALPLKKTDTKKDLDAVPPAFTVDGGKTKYSDPAGVPGLLVPNPDPGKSGDGYVKKPDGTKGPWGKYGASGVLLRHRGEDGTDRFLLVQRGKGLSSNVGKWQLPGGGIDSNETPLEGAAREVIEELGFKPEDVAKGRVHGFSEAVVPTMDGEWKYTSIAATVPDQLVPDLSGENAQLETGDAKWLTLDEIQAMDDNGDLLGPLSGGKWHDQIVDLFPEVKTSKPKKSAIGTGTTAAVEKGDFSGLKQLTGAKGSNEGGIFVDADGQKWYVKKQKDAAHAENERVASALYREAGIDVPEVIVGTGTPGLSSGIHTATKIVPEGSTKLKGVVAGQNQEKLKAIRTGFAIDALLANWDVAGLTYDNIIFDQDGKPHRIDVGGALEFRAQGGPKGSAFGTSVTEWDTLRDPKKNPQSASIFGGMTDAEKIAAVDRVEQLTPEKIKTIVKDQALADKLIARRQDLLDRAQKEDVLSSTSSELSFEFVDETMPELNPATSTVPPTLDVSANVTMPGQFVDVVDEKLSPAEIWSNAQSGDYADGQIIAQGSSKRLRAHKLASGKYIIAEEFKSDGSWKQTGSWVKEGEFVDTVDLPTYSGGYHAFESQVEIGDVVDDGPGSTGVNPYTGGTLYTPIGQLTNDKPGFKSHLWGQLQKGLFADGDPVADYYDNDGAIHRIIAKHWPDSDEWEFIQQKQDDDGLWSFEKLYKSADELEKADLTSFGIGAKGGPAGTKPAGSPALNLWNDVQSPAIKNGDVIAQTTDADGTHWRLVKVDAGGFPGSTPTVKMQKAGKHADLNNSTSWKTQDFISDDLHFVEVMETKFGGVSQVGAPVPPPIKVTQVAEVPQVTAPAGSHLELWQKLQAKQFAPDDLLGEYVSPSGYTHQLRVASDGKSIIHWTKNPDTSKPQKIKESFSSEEQLLAADLSLFKTPKAKGPGPKIVPKLTNAIIYGKYSEGEVIATKFNSTTDATPQRLIFKNSKIVHQVQQLNGTWTTSATYGKGEAYKKIGGTGPWSLGEPVSVGGEQLVTSAPTIAVSPTPEPVQLAPVTFYKKSSIKSTFKGHLVKWHTAAPTMLEAAVKAQQQNPDLTLGQILAVMDGTTTTQTDTSPFTTKISKYLSTAKGKQQAKALGLPTDAMVKSGATSGTSKPGTSTPSTPKVPFTSVVVDPNASHTLLDPGSHSFQAPPEGYKIHNNSEMSKIQDEMVTKYGDWTSAQRAALKKYTGSSYHAMNECLRKPHTCTASTIKDNETAAAGMRPLTTSIRVTRGVGWSFFPGLGSKSGLSNSEKIKQVQAAIGKILREPGFTSTSSASTPAFGGPVRLIIDVPVGAPAAWVKNISHYGSENELLMPPRMKYRIKKVAPGAGYEPTIVHMEVVYP